MLRATPARNFSTSQLPKVLRRWRVLYVLTSKCASRHNSVQFFISHLPTWLPTRRFSEPTFRPSGATNHWKKHSKSRLSYLFAHLHLLSSYSFSSTLLSSALLFSDFAFPSVHIVGSLTSKLPSIHVYTQLVAIQAIFKKQMQTRVNDISSHAYNHLTDHDHTPCFNGSLVLKWKVPGLPQSLHFLGDDP